MATNLQYREIDQAELLQAECVDIAKQSWLINQHPPFVVGFKGEDNYPMMMPGFSATPEVQDRFIEIVSECEDWDALAVFTCNIAQELQIKLIMADKIMISTANIAYNYGARMLNDFSQWQEIRDEVRI